MVRLSLQLSLLAVNVLLLALVMLDDGLPALPHHHAGPGPAQGLGLVRLRLLALVFCSSVLKPDFHLKLFIVITFYINLINNSDWSTRVYGCVCRNLSMSPAQFRTCIIVSLPHCSG